MRITVDISEEEIDLLDSCVSATKREGYDVTEDEKVITKLRDALKKAQETSTGA